MICYFQYKVYKQYIYKYINKYIMSRYDEYQHPLIERYASNEMKHLWSPEKKFSTWRELWCVLAKSQQELGIHITNEQIIEMKNNIYNIDFAYAEEMEKILKHDVMAHVHTFGKQCPLAKPIIHLGATSCYVGDNTDIILMREGLKKINDNLQYLMKIMKSFCIKYKDLPTLGFTHYQPAQLTTVGKRAALWLQDILMDFNDINNMIEILPLRGIKGTTGTQGSFLELFNGDHKKVLKLNQKICNYMKFSKCINISGQTYTRKIDYKVITSLSGIAQSAYKMCSDIRLLSNLKEIDEPFDKSQIGSSAMPYKRNPMLCERVCSISRYILNLPTMCAQTHSSQWLERTLDDSAIRRMIIPESFLATDTIIHTMIKIMSDIIVWPNVIKNRIKSELPFMATEVILMKCVQNGGDRQDIHEALRKHSMEASRQVKEYGKENDLLERIKSDILFESIHDDLDSLLDPKLFIGRSSEQVTEFLEENNLL